MQIELFGCTSAGKTTFACEVLRMCQDKGINLILGDEFVLRQFRLEWLRGSLARKLAMYFASLIGFLVFYRHHNQFFIFVFTTLMKLPISLYEKLYLARNIIMRMGMYEIIQHWNYDQQVVLVDGGSLQIAHQLFVHVSVSNNLEDLLTFVRLVPLPEAAVYVTQNRSIMVERTRNRKHKRINDCTDKNVLLFVNKAIDTFDNLVQHIIIEDRLLMLNNRRRVLLKQDHRNNPILFRIIEHVIAEIDPNLVDDAAIE